MNCFLAQSFVDFLVNTFETLQEQFAPMAGLWGIFLLLLPAVGLCYAIYFLLSLPMRRRERARIFLDLIETGLRRGYSPEQTIVMSAGSRDPALGVRFQLLAAHIENGLRLGQALDKVPRLLPPPIAATLKTGLEIGDLARILPACRRQLRDTLSQTRSALNYLTVMVFVVMPAFPIFFWMVLTWILPRFAEIYKDMLPGVPLPSAWSFALMSYLVYVQIGVMVLLQLLALCYVGGPRLKAWSKGWVSPAVDALAWRLPWRKKRLQRDFSSLLALLLDAGFPEARAVRLAAASTANSLLEKRAEVVSDRLAAGVPLMQAIQLLDDSGELRWRLANVAHSKHGFLQALTGWIEALDAKAFQQEQVAAQLLTSGVVLFNGLMVGFFAVSVFSILVTMIQEGTLW
jgi:type II secretory pathway component PulF